MAISQRTAVATPILPPTPFLTHQHPRGVAVCPDRSIPTETPLYSVAADHRAGGPVDSTSHGHSPAMTNN